MKPPNAHILAINGGSSSIKFAIFNAGGSLRRILKGSIATVTASMTISERPKLFLGFSSTLNGLIK
jgi:acetate kinase